jgi:hypothetical protein
MIHSILPPTSTLSLVFSFKQGFSELVSFTITKFQLFSVLFLFSALTAHAALDVDPMNSLCEETAYSINSSVYVDRSIRDPKVLYRAVQNSSEDTVHIFTHGKPGSLLIDGVWLDAVGVQNWLQNNFEIENYTRLHIYGCNFAQSEKGKKAIAYLENELGLTVAASTDITGRDGDWHLEIGNVDLILDSYAFNLQCTGAPTEDCDNDGVTNENDIDDDNDGILDTDEDVCVETVGTSNRLAYQFFDIPGTPRFETVDSIPTAENATATGFVSDFDVQALQLIHTPSDTHTFAVRYTGKIYISTADTYTFFTFSDDGSKLFINDVEVVDNDGLHGIAEESGTIFLSVGYHDFRVEYFEWFGFETLTASYTSSSISKQEIPFTILGDNLCGPDVDTDADGIPNRLDLDSDNDGIPDNIEAQSSNGYIAPNGVVGTNGLDSAYENNDTLAATGLDPENTDNLDSPDFLDIDSDNDELFDIEESGDGLTDSNNDGRTDGVVGDNGLDNTVDAGGLDNYADPNGKFDTTQDDNFTDTDGDVNSGGDLDYRDVPVIVAVDDFVIILEGAGGLDLINVLTNDTLDGVSATTTTVSITQISTTDADVNINTSTGGVNIANTVLEGSYTIEYQICVSGSTTVCNTAFVTAFVDLDTDNDTIYNNVDIDDDNDGILDIDEGLVQVLLDEDFGTGIRTNVSGISGAPNPVNTFFNYQSSGTIRDGQYGIVNNVDDGAGVEIVSWTDNDDNTPNDVNGRMLLVNAGETLGDVYATQLNVTPNVDITISYYVLNILDTNAPVRDTDPDISFELRTSAGALIGSLDAGIVPRNQIFNQYTVTLNPGNNSVIEIALVNNVQAITGNDFAIDDILVFQEGSSDTDGDGIFNHLDLDSDNDGIPDNIEAQGTTNYTAPSGTVGANGLDSAYENIDTLTATGLNPLNTDGMDLPDFLDLDSDNDNLFDINESGDGLTDANNDGQTDGVVGENGMDNTVDNSGNDDYVDVNGKFDDSQDDNFTDTDGDVNTGGDVDYREPVFFIDMPTQIVLENVAFTSVAPTLTDAPVGTNTYSLSGVDAGNFTINASTGVVTMIARDFENPVDDNFNNFYNLFITVSSSTGTSAITAFNVIVNNECEIVETLQNYLRATDALGDVSGDTGTLEIEIVDETGTPRSGVQVVITQEIGPGTIASATGTTNASGIYTTTVSSTTAGSATYSAQYAATTGSADTDVELGNPTSVRFLDDINNVAVTGEVGIATDTPDPSSVLEIVSTDKGLLIPNVSLKSSSDTVTIPRPTISLMVYNTNDTASLAAGFVFFNGSVWVPICQEPVIIRE